MVAKDNEDIQAELTAANEKIKRLREALERIADQECQYGSDDMSYSKEDRLAYWNIMVARQALAETEDK